MKQKDDNSGSGVKSIKAFQSLFLQLLSNFIICNILIEIVGSGQECTLKKNCDRCNQFIFLHRVVDRVKV